jgi:6-phosphofructokinase 1
VEGGGRDGDCGKNAVMPAIAVSDKPYRWKITEVPLDKVANVEKMLPPDFISGTDSASLNARAATSRH